MPDDNYSCRLLLTLDSGKGRAAGVKGKLAERGGFEPPVQL